MVGSRREERTQLRGFIGIALAIGGFLWLLAQTLLSDWIGNVEHPYLAAVLSRTLGDPYRLALLSAALAVFPNALSVSNRRRKAANPELIENAFDRAGLMVQMLFTSFGFLGTIIGVSIAVSGLEAAMESREPAALIGGLGTAFDTTFLGLCGAILVIIARRMMSLSINQEPAK